MDQILWKPSAERILRSNKNWDSHHIKFAKY